MIEFRWKEVIRVAGEPLPARAVCLASGECAVLQYRTVMRFKSNVQYETTTLWRDVSYDEAKLAPLEPANLTEGCTRINSTMFDIRTDKLLVKSGQYELQMGDAVEGTSSTGQHHVILLRSETSKMYFVDTKNKLAWPYATLD